MLNQQEFEMLTSGYNHMVCHVTCNRLQVESASVAQIQQLSVQSYVFAVIALSRCLDRQSGEERSSMLRTVFMHDLWTLGYASDPLSTLHTHLC